MIYAIVAGLSVLAIGLAVLFARRDGASSEKAAQAEKGAEDVRKAENARSGVDRLPDGASADKLRSEWSRDL